MSTKRIYTPEMLADLGKMTDKDFGKKWGINRIVVIRNRNKMGIPSFLPKSNVKRKIVDGIEYKWCPRGGGHWCLLSEFKLSPTRAGGYRGICHKHEKKDRVGDYHKNNGKEKAQQWRKTENGRKSLRNTWRKQTALKKNAYVKWGRPDESRAYEIFEHRCGYCREDVDYLTLEFDHYVPVSLGGKTEPKNMVPCCVKCNHGIDGKFKREPEEWIRFRFQDYAEEVISYVNDRLHILAVLGNG